MQDDRRQELARKRAEIYAPKPTGGSAMAGLCVAVVAVVADFAVSGFYGWRVQNHLPLSAAVVIVGFLLGLIGYKTLARANRKATEAERRGINDDEALKRESSIER